MRILAAVVLAVLMLAGTVEATAWGSGAARADLDTLEAILEKVDSVFGDPAYGSTYDRNLGSVYQSFYDLTNTSIAGQTVSNSDDARRKATMSDAATNTMSTGFIGSPFFVGVPFLKGYADAIYRADGITLDEYWFKNCYDSLADTSRAGWAVAAMARAYGVSRFRPIISQPKPKQILATFTVTDSSYTDSTEINTALTGGGLLEAYIQTAIAMAVPGNNETLRFKVYGKDFNGSTISETATIPYTSFAAKSKVNLGGSQYFADVTSITSVAWSNYSAISTGQVQIRTRRDRSVR